MADGIVTILARNMEVNLRDKTNFTDLAALKGWATSDEWRPLSLATPYAVIVIGGQGEIVQGIEAQTWEQAASVYVAERAAPSLSGERALLGVVSVKSGLDTLATFVRKALVRPSPYNDRKPGTPFAGAYVTQAGVLHVSHTGTEYLGYEEDPEGEEASGVQVVRVDLSYILVDDID